MQKRIIFYEVNPLYYKDSNNDGIGDLKGMTKQVDYFSHLGVDAIVIPNILSMYSEDTKNNDSYKKIVHEIGSIEDFRIFANKMKLRGIKIIIDINIGSIRESHEWFRQASSNKDHFDKMITQPKKDEFGDVIVNKETQEVGETKLNAQTNTYYFVNEQTQEVSLNWKGGTIRNMFLDVARFWNNLGVEGFRFSNFEYLGQVKPNNKLEEETTLIELRRFYRSLKEMNENFIIIGKSEIVSHSESKILLAENTRVLDYFQPLNYSKIGLDAQYGNDLVGKFTSNELAKLIKKYVSGADSILSFGTNITGRPLSRWGGNDEYNVELSKTLAIIQLFYVSSPLIYYGEELGAKNMGLTHLDNFQDNTLYERKRSLQDKGVDVKDFMAAQVLQNPINAHTLMAWTDKKNGGFSNKEKTIVPPSHSYRDINVMNQYTSDSMPLNFYRKIIKFVKSDEIQEILRDGTSSIKILKFGRGLLQITHSYEGREIIVLSNLSNKAKNITQPSDFKLLTSSYYDKDYHKGVKTLQEYETIVFVKNIETEVENNEPILPKRVTPISVNNTTSTMPLKNDKEINNSAVETFAKRKHVSDLLGKWAVNNKDISVQQVNSKDIPKKVDAEKNLINIDDTNEENHTTPVDIQTTMEMATNNIDDNNHQGEKHVKNITHSSNQNNHMSGTIEMITDDIENTSEMNFDDSILDSDIHDTQQTHKAARDITKSINNSVNNKDEFLEKEREQNINPNDKTHSSKYNG